MMNVRKIFRMFLRHYWKGRQIIGLEVIWLECLPCLNFILKEKFIKVEGKGSKQRLVPIFFTCHTRTGTVLSRPQRRTDKARI